MKKSTIIDVANQAKVSVKTVSRVINNHPSVSTKTRTAVEKAIYILGYTPDAAARNLRSATTYVIGLVYDNPNPYHIIGMQNGVLAVCRQYGFGLQIYPCNASSPMVADELFHWVKQSRLAGLVLTAPISESNSIIQHLNDFSIKFSRIIAAQQAPELDYPCVYINDKKAAYSITEYLIQLGHQRIGFLWGNPLHGSSVERFLGYQHALSDYGVEYIPELVLQGDYTFDDGFRGARRLLGLSSPPTAIFGSNDEIAAGVVAAAHSIGLQIPYNLSIAGFEDSPFSKQSWPALTTAKQATFDIAAQAARLLIYSINKNNSAIKNIEESLVAPQNNSFLPELIVRGSTAPPRTK